MQYQLWGYRLCATSDVIGTKPYVQGCVFHEVKAAIGTMMTTKKVSGGTKSIPPLYKNKVGILLTLLQYF